MVIMKNGLDVSKEKSHGLGIFHCFLLLSLPPCINIKKDSITVLATPLNMQDLNPNQGSNLGLPTGEQ